MPSKTGSLADAASLAGVKKVPSGSMPRTRACSVGGPSYEHVDSVLRNGLDRLVMAAPTADEPLPDHDNPASIGASAVPTSS